MLNRATRWAGCIPAVIAMSTLIGCTASQQNDDNGAQAQTTTETSPAAEPAARPAAATTGNGFNINSAAFPTGNRETSAIFLEKRMPAEVSVGQPFTYDLIVTNISSLDLSNVVVTDSMPNDFDFAGAEPRGTVSGGDMAWNIGSLAPNQSRTIRVNGAATSTGTIGSCGTVTYDTSVCVETRVVEPSLRLALTCTPRVMLCDPITLTYVVSNPGTGPARNVVINEDLPAGLQLESGGTAVRYRVENLAPGASETFSVIAKATRTGTFTANGSAVASGNLTADAGNCNITVVQPELTITASAPANRYLGRSADFCFVVTNEGDGEAANTVVVANVPTGATVSGITGGGTAGNGTVTWNLGTLAPGASREICFTVPASQIGVARATARVTADCADPATDDAQTEFAGIPAILLEVIDVEDPIEVGANVVYEIRVTNQGSAIDRNIAIVCDLEDSMRYVSATGATAARSSGSTVTFAPVGALAPGEVAVWRVTIQAASEGDVRFTVTMNSDFLTRNVRETESTNFYR
jgi:uncharacterized repeat protein (TIGR01451 family)